MREVLWAVFKPWRVFTPLGLYLVGVLWGAILGVCLWNLLT